MNIEYTLMQLQAKAASPERARELGQMGYMQWLGWLPGDANYEVEAARAYLKASPFIATDPAVAEFCALLRASLEGPHVPLKIALPRPQRRGGASERRLSL